MRRFRMIGFLSMLLFAGGFAQAAGGATTSGLKDFVQPPSGAEGVEVKWSVWECPKKDECNVKIVATISGSVCELSTWDFVDKNPEKTPQTIVWSIGEASTSGYDYEFTGDGIAVTENGDDIETNAADRKKDSHKKKIKKKTRSSLVLYDVHVRYRIKGSTDPNGWSDCKPKGPAIVNRG